MPIATSTSTTNRPKLSAVTTPKLVALRPQSRAAVIPAPARPTSPRPLIAIRSPGCRRASASMQAMPAAVTQRIGTMAAKSEADIIGLPFPGRPCPRPPPGSSPAPAR